MALAFWGVCFVPPRARPRASFFKRSQPKCNLIHRKYLMSVQNAFMFLNNSCAGKQTFWWKVNPLDWFAENRGWPNWTPKHFRMCVLLTERRRDGDWRNGGCEGNAQTVFCGRRRVKRGYGTCMRNNKSSSGSKCEPVAIASDQEESQQWSQRSFILTRVSYWSHGDSPRGQHVHRNGEGCGNYREDDLTYL